MSFCKTEFTRVMVSGMEFPLNLFTLNQFVRSLSANVVRAIAMIQLCFEERRLYQRILFVFLDKYKRFVLSSKERVNATKS